MSEHISAGDWLRLLDHQMPRREELSLLRHIAGCAECRALMDRAKDLRWALEREAARGEENEYLAVAGPSAAASASPAGFLRVEIALESGVPVFRDESLQARGAGNKYAMNLSPDGRTFADDEDLLVLSLSGGVLRVDFRDGGVRAGASLLVPDGSSLPVAFGAEGTPLPEGAFPCVLELVFG